MATKMASNRLVQRQNFANEGRLKRRKPQRMNNQKTCLLLAFHALMVLFLIRFAAGASLNVLHHAGWLPCRGPYFCVYPTKK